MVKDEKMKKLLILTLLSLFMSLGFAQEQTIQDQTTNEPTTVEQEDIDEQNRLSDSSIQDITPKSLNEYFEEFKDNFGISEYGESIEGKNGGVKTFYTGSAICPKTPNDPNFVKYLQMTFSKALIDMQSAYVEDTFGKVSNSITRRLYSDEDKKFDKLPAKSKFMQLWNKTMQLGEAQIDEKLRSLGVEPKESYDLVRKKELFADTISQQIIKRAVGNIKGLVPIRTIVTIDKKGVYNVGVIAVMSTKTIQLADDMRYKRPSVFKGKGKNLKEFIPKNKEQFTNEFGIRMVYDQNGEPMILSYAQWGVMPEKNPVKFASKKEISKKKAKSLADAQISDFINSHITSKNIESQSSQVSTTLTQKIKANDEELTEDDVTDMIDKSNSQIKLHSSSRLRGIRSVKSWEFEDKNGLLHVGVMRFYKYSNVEDTKKMLNAKSHTRPTSKKAKKATGASKVVNDIDDF